MRKKIIYGVCMLGLVALVSTSCKKNEDNTKSFAANFGALQAVSIDGDERAYFDPETLLTYWQAGDQVKVYNFENGRAAIYQTQDAGLNTGRFVSTEGAIGSASGYYAFYPAEMAEDDFDGTYQTFTLGPIQRALPMDSDYESYAMQSISIPQAAYTTAQDAHFYMNIIFGMARFRVKCHPAPGETPGTFGQARYIQKIVVKDNHFNLHGTVRLKPNKINPTLLDQMMTRLIAGGVDDMQYKDMWDDYVVSHVGEGLGYSAIGGGKELTYDYSTLNDGKGVKLSNAHDMFLWVGLRPGAFAYGFTVDLYVWDNGVTKIIPFTKWENPKYAMAARPGIVNTFNIGSITELVNNYPQ